MLAIPLRQQFPETRWASHSQGVTGCTLIERALVDGAHVRVGFEDVIHLPDGCLAPSNAELVRWSVAAAQAAGRTPATIAEARVITGANRARSIRKSGPERVAIELGNV